MNEWFSRHLESSLRFSQVTVRPAVRIALALSNVPDQIAEIVNEYALLDPGLAALFWRGEVFHPEASVNTGSGIWKITIFNYSCYAYHSCGCDDMNGWSIDVFHQDENVENVLDISRWEFWSELFEERKTLDHRLGRELRTKFKPPMPISVSSEIARHLLNALCDVILRNSATAPRNAKILALPFCEHAL